MFCEVRNRREILTFSSPNQISTNYNGSDGAHERLNQREPESVTVEKYTTYCRCCAPVEKFHLKCSLSIHHFFSLSWRIGGRVTTFFRPAGPLVYSCCLNPAPFTGYLSDIFKRQHICKPLFFSRLCQNWPPLRERWLKQISILLLLRSQRSRGRIKPNKWIDPPRRNDRRGTNSETD